LLGLALAYEVPMAQIVKLFVEKGEDIFSARKLPSGAVTRLLDLTRSVLGPQVHRRDLAPGADAPPG
jgi:hypothetical protein